mgnify:CR=1 FL=1
MLGFQVTLNDVLVIFDATNPVTCVGVLPVDVNIDVTSFNNSKSDLPVFKLVFIEFIL